MSTSLIALGPYRFATPLEIPHDAVSHESEYRWEAQPRLARRPAMQFAGAGEERIVIEGVIFPHHTGGFDQLEDMRREARKGKPFNLVQLIENEGRVHGKFCILAIGNTQKYFHKNGTPQKLTFGIELAHYGADSGGGFSGFLNLF